MAGRRERCDGCGVYLPVPPEARVIRCSRCNSDTRVRPFDGWAQVHDSLVPVYPENGFPQVHAPQQRPVSLSPHPARQRRKALLIGLNYRNQSCSLKGSINDVKSMRALLVRRLGFQSDSILMLTEEEMNPLLIPTKENIRKVMRWLVGGCQPGDSLVFHYSGHGSRKKDSNGDEIDGFDEAICPLDHETKGLILDDEINSTMVRPLPQGVTLHAVIDSCYSGTVFDLPYHCRMNREGYYMWQSQYPKAPYADYKGTSGGLAICFSACGDSERSGDTTAFTRTKARTGAMTTSFVQVLQNEPGILTYGGLLNAMRQVIRENKPGAQLTGSTEAQEPQLSSSSKFEIYSKQFMI